jgi:hypothetical protein
MSTGRIRGDQDKRFYVDGYDLSGYQRKVGELKWESDAPVDAASIDPIKSIVAVGQVQLGIGTFNGFFDNTPTNGLHVVMNGAGVKRVVMIPQGIRAAPTQGDPVYSGEFDQLDYKSQVDNRVVVASIAFGDVDAVAAALAYSKPWGVLLHAKAEETGANTAIGVDGGAQTTKGGYMVYQIFAVSGTGDVTLSVQDADTNLNGSFAALSPPLTSGAIAHTAVPCAGVVALATTQTIKQFTRWQMALSGITGCTFALAFVRG